MEMNNFTDPHGTKLLGYSSWQRLGTTDPEVDSPYLTIYYIIAMKLITGKDSPFEFFNALSHYTAHEDAKEVIFRRFPRPGQNYTLGHKRNRPKAAHFDDPRNLSGDNTLPIIIGLGEYNCRTTVQKAFRSLMRRGFFFQNTHTNEGKKKFLPDFCGPSRLIVYLRALRNIYLYPFILLCDVFLFLSIVVHVIESYFKANTASELNYIFTLIQSERIYPTPFSKLSILAYGSTLKKRFDSEPRIYGAVMEFFTANRYRPPFHELMKPILLMYFKEYKK